MIIRFVEIENRARGGLWWRVPVVVIVWALLIAPAIAAAILFATLRGYVVDLPEVPSLSVWRASIPETSVIVAADGSPLAELPFTDGAVIGHRTWAALDELPQVLIDAFLAAEDERFYAHYGVDPQSVVRAALANYKAGEIVEGASTITQQLARNLLPAEIGDERSARRKVRESMMAIRIEKRYDKREILEAYVNLVFLGAQSYGVKAASLRYFGKRLADLSAAEAALIAGLAQAPGRADPTVSLELARARRDDVLERMEDAGFLSAADRAAAAAQPIELAPAVRHYGTVSAWHTERARQTLEADHPALYRRGGLRVETTAEPAIGLAAEEAARRRARALAGRDSMPEVAAVAIDYQTGYIETLIGGTDFAKSVFDRALMACRQPGSAFKPLLYGAALERDAITPGTALRDGPIAEWDEDLGVHWKPQNSGRTFRGIAVAEDALASSLNAPAVDVLDRVGGEAVISFAHRLGISSKLVNVRPLALGASCVIPFELARAFAVIANRGMPVRAIIVKQVRRGVDVMLDEATAFDPMLAADRRLDRIVVTAAAESDPVIDEETAFMLASMLRAVVARGTGVAARAVGRAAAGKTGTTNDNSDAWFVGFTGRLAAAVWIGHDDPTTKLPGSADGARGALPLWVTIVRASEGARADVAVPGAAPEGLESAQIDRETGLVAERGAGGSIALYFRRGTAPTTSAGTRPDLPTSLERATRQF